MTIDQQFKLYSILIIGFVLGIVSILFKENSCKWILKYGGVLIILGLVGSMFTTKMFLETLLLIDASGIGRAYVVGCMLFVAGLVCALLNRCKSLFRKNVD